MTFTWVGCYVFKSMGSDLIFLVGLALLSFASKSYSNMVSLVFENLFIKFFRTLSPNYLKSYGRAFLLSLISFRNQGISFTALSFLNSGIIPNFQALALILGSYLGLSVSLFYLSLHDTLLKFVLVALGLFLAIFTHKNKVIYISKMIFFLAMILFGFNLLSISMFSVKEPLLLSVVGGILSPHRLLVVPFALVLYFVFRNSFTVLAILYAFFLKGILSHEQILNAILSVLLYNSIWYLWCTRKAHRETRAVSCAVVLITVLIGIFLIGIEILWPGVLIGSEKIMPTFALSLICTSALMGLFGYALSYFINLFTDSIFAKLEIKEPRHILLFTSSNHYPIAFLVEYFEQEFKKLFALLNSTQQIVIASWMNSQENTFERAQKYFGISFKILKELEDLEIQINQVEKTHTQADVIYKLHDKISGLRILSLSLRTLNDIQQRFTLPRFETLNENRNLFLDTTKKVLEFSEYIFSSILDREQGERINTTTLSSQISDELLKFKEQIYSLKSENILKKEEVELVYEYLEQLQFLSLAIQRISK